MTMPRWPAGRLRLRRRNSSRNSFAMRQRPPRRADARHVQGDGPRAGSRKEPHPVPYGTRSRPAGPGSVRDQRARLFIRAAEIDRNDLPLVPPQPQLTIARRVSRRCAPSLATRSSDHPGTRRGSAARAETPPGTAVLPTTPAPGQPRACGTCASARRWPWRHL